MFRILKYNIYYPSGNTTALVTDFVTLKYRKKVNDEIMRLHDDVEQVGFVYVDKNKYYLDMAGGEFCGNATRSAAYYFLNGHNGELKINVSGVDRSLVAGINGSISYAEIPFSRNSFLFNTNLQKIQGINHIIVEVDNNLTQSSAMLLANQYITQYVENIKSSPLALGVMFTKKENDKYVVFPVVKVFSVDTVFYETACASGSACIALYEHNKYSKKINNLSIKQPSGEYINVRFVYKQGKVIQGFIEGDQKIISLNNELVISE